MLARLHSPCCWFMRSPSWSPSSSATSSSSPQGLSSASSSSPNSSAPKLRRVSGSKQEVGGGSDVAAAAVLQHPPGGLKDAALDPQCMPCPPGPHQAAGRHSQLHAAALHALVPSSSSRKEVIVICHVEGLAQATGRKMRWLRMERRQWWPGPSIQRHKPMQDNAESNKAGDGLFWASWRVVGHGRKFGLDRQSPSRAGQRLIPSLNAHAARAA